MALENALVDRVEAWNDGLGNEWREHIPGKLKGASRIAIEVQKMPALVRTYVDSLVDASSLEDVTPSFPQCA